MTRTLSATTTTYFYDGHNVAQELSGTTPIANFLSGGIDEVFTRSESTGTLAPLVDGVGSTIGLSDSSGAVQTQYTYEPFGNTTAAGAASANASQYTGRENDGTGLYYYRARYYSPTLQRFMSEDPIGFNGGDSNLYAYVRNNPVGRRDPFGLRDIEAVPDGPEYPLVRPPNPAPPNYVNIQVAGGFVLGGFGGVVIGDGGLYFYGGGGMVFGSGLSITRPIYPWDSPDPNFGWNTEQGGCFYGCGTLGGAAQGSGGKPTVEVGLGLPTKGYHGGVYYVFPPVLGRMFGRSSH